MPIFKVILLVSIFSGMVHAQEAPETDEGQISEETSQVEGSGSQTQAGQGNDEVAIDGTSTVPVTQTKEELKSPYDSSGVELEKAQINMKTEKFCQCTFRPDIPYRTRRGTWGGFFGAQGGTFSPTNYQPDFTTGSFDSVYGSSGFPVEVVAGGKLNTLAGSLGVNFTAGSYTAAKGTNTLSLNPITVGGIAALDTIFKEPYIVPYGIVGLYTVIYSEKSGGLSVRGNSDMALFYAAGAMFQLDWMDLESHDAAYLDYGLENIYLFVEGRSFMAASKAVPNFSTPIHYNVGLKFEF